MTGNSISKNTWLNVICVFCQYFKRKSHSVFFVAIYNHICHIVFRKSIPPSFGFWLFCFDSYESLVFLFLGDILGNLFDAQIFLMWWYLSLIQHFWYYLDSQFYSRSSILYVSLDFKIEFYLWRTSTQDNYTRKKLFYTCKMKYEARQ